MRSAHVSGHRCNRYCQTLTFPLYYHSLVREDRSARSLAALPMIIPEQTLNRLLDALYDAAADPLRWDDFLSQLTRATNGDSAALVTNDFESASASVAHQFGLSADGPRLYADHYAKLDVWSARARDQVGRPTWSAASEELCPWSEFCRTEYYHDFLRPQGVAQGIFSTVENSSLRLTSLSIYKGQKGEFSDAGLEILQLLTPHVRRAFRLRSQFSRLRSYTDGLSAALDAMPTAIFLLGQKGVVLGMNQAAATLMSQKDGLIATSAGLCADSPRETADLHAVMYRATALSHDKGPCQAFTLKVSRKSRRPLQVLISPVRNLSFVSDQRVSALAFVNDPDDRPLPQPAVLQVLFGLTPAESRVALHLADGNDLRTACDELSITYATARAHLRNIFQKLGVRRQAELTSLVLRLTAPIHTPRGTAQQK